MNKTVLKKLAALSLAGCMTASMIGCGAKDDTKPAQTNAPAASGEATDKDEKDTQPDEEVKEEYTITLGRQVLQNPKLPEGDTYEDNAYTRMVKDALGITLVDEFEADGDNYERQISLALTGGELPDIMKVSSRDLVRELYENDLIADITDVYNTYASDYLKEVYDSYGGRAIDNVTYDGMMMALPATNTDAGPSEVWVRSDWTEALGITLDEDGNSAITIDELKTLAETFMEKNPGNAENPIGLAFAPWLFSGDPDGTFSMNSIAYAMGATPKTWLNQDGEVAYGSVSDEMKEVVVMMADWYKNGLVDPQLGTRTWDDITAMLCNGETGITFGTWYIPDWLLNNVRATDGKATFQSYAIEDKDGKVLCKHNDATAGYMVVSKSCEHPEALIKIANLFYDTLPTNSAWIAENYPEVAEYQKTGVDGSTRPFNIEVNSYTSLLSDFGSIEKGVNGEIAPEEATTTEGTNVIINSLAYLADPENSEVSQWSAYHSRMKGIKLIQTLTDNDTFKWITPIFPEPTATMKTNQANLDKLEEETFIKIVTGAVPAAEGFDQFVKDWYAQGGEQILSEIKATLN